MADETPAPEESPEAAGSHAAGEDQAAESLATDEASPQQDGGGEDAAKKPAKGVPWLAVLALVGLGLLLALEGAGLLLRDRLEDRRPRLAEAPAVVGEAEGDTTAATAAGTRFGPEVKEVAVATADSRPPPAPPEPKQAPPPKPPATATKPAPITEAPPPETEPPSPAPPPEPAVEVTAPPAPPKPTSATGDHALQVGIFGSQKYRIDMERKLEEAGQPHFRSLRSRLGEGYRLALAIPDASQQKQAQATLDDEGYLYTIQDGSLEAWFHFEAEAQRALKTLSTAGLNGGYAKAKGDVPLWVVYAGPFPTEEAKRVRQELAILGLPSYLRTIP